MKRRFQIHRVLCFLFAVFTVLPMMFVSVSGVEYVSLDGSSPESDLRVLIGEEELGKLILDETVTADDGGRFVSVIRVLEFGYDAREENWDYYGLYLYLYNPSGDPLATTTKNCVEMSVDFAGGDRSEVAKYPLKLLSFSEDHVLYKFEITGLRMSLLQRMDIAERTYNISGMEIQFSGERKAKDFDVAMKVMFTGFNAGFDRNRTQVDSLYWYYSQLETIEVELHPTSWMSDTSDKGKGYKYEVSGVYFAIPNYYLKTYGNWEGDDDLKGLYAVKGSFNESRVNGIVTDSDQVYELANETISYIKNFYGIYSATDPTLNVMPNPEPQPETVTLQKGYYTLKLSCTAPAEAIVETLTLGYLGNNLVYAEMWIPAVNSGSAIRLVQTTGAMLNMSYWEAGDGTINLVYESESYTDADLPKRVISLPIDEVVSKAFGDWLIANSEYSATDPTLNVTPDPELQPETVTLQEGYYTLKLSCTAPAEAIMEKVTLMYLETDAIYAEMWIPAKDSGQAIRFVTANGESVNTSYLDWGGGTIGLVYTTESYTDADLYKRVIQLNDSPVVSKAFGDWLTANSEYSATRPTASVTPDPEPQPETVTLQEGYYTLKLSCTAPEESMMTGELLFRYLGNEVIYDTMMISGSSGMRLYFCNETTGASVNPPYQTMEDGTMQWVSDTAYTDADLPKRVIELSSDTVVSKAYGDWLIANSEYSATDPTLNITPEPEPETYMLTGKYIFADEITLPSETLSLNKTFSTNALVEEGAAYDGMMIYSTDIMLLNGATVCSNGGYPGQIATWTNSWEIYIDFGSEGVTVEKAFYDWFIANVTVASEAYTVSGVYAFHDTLTFEQGYISERVNFNDGYVRFTIIVDEAASGGKEVPLILWTNTVDNYMYEGGGVLPNIDFGSDQQTVSELFYEWLNANADKVTETAQAASVVAEVASLDSVETENPRAHEPIELPTVSLLCA